MTSAPATPYDVIGCEYAIQWQGCLLGTPAVFLHLGPPPENGEQRLSAKECADLCLRTLAKQSRKVGTAADDLYPAEGAWVVVTGAPLAWEPAIPDLEALVGALQSAGFWVALETGGTARGHIGAGFDWVTVIPRPQIPGDGQRVNWNVDAEAMASADEVKLEVADRMDVAAFLTLLERYPAKSQAVVCIQPKDGDSAAFCTEQSLMQGWRLSPFPPGGKAVAG